MLPPGYSLREGADPIAAQAYLSRSYWAKGRSLSTIERSIEGSLAISILRGRKQVAMARVITDYATIAYLADVYVLEDHRGLGLSKAMLAYIHCHPRLQGLSRWLLATNDAHGLYRQFGWDRYPDPERMMTFPVSERHGA